MYLLRFEVRLTTEWYPAYWRRRSGVPAAVVWQSTTCSGTVNSQLWYVVEGVYWWSMDYLCVGLIHWCLLVFHEVFVCGTHSFQHWTVIDTWWKVYWCSMKYLCVGLTHSWLIHSNTEPSSPVRVTALAIAVLIVAVRGRGPGYCGVVNWSITVKLKLESDCHEWNSTYEPDVSIEGHQNNCWQASIPSPK